MPDLEGRLDAAIAAATTLAIDATAAEAASKAIRTRSGFPGDLYVLALAGGTGVGKSSLLNALAGSVVSAAGVHRPTTTTAIAFVPAAHATDAVPLLDWLGGASLAVPARGQDESLRSVAILDLPDLDSVEPAHAARVDSVLPRVDAVLWVSDPEKYADAVLHDRYLRRWLPRLGRQAFALNKVDRLGPDDVRRLHDDLAGRLAAAGAPGLPIVVTSALRGDTHALESWLADGVDARAVVRQRLDAAARSAMADLGRAAGVAGDTAPAPLIPDADRTAAAAAATRAVLGVVDLEGLRQQAVAATQAAARTQGGGPMGIARSFIARGSGARARSADPEGYLRRWRERGTLAPAAQPIREVITSALSALPPSARPGVAALADTESITAHLVQATDRAVAGPAGRFHTPEASRTWPIIGLLQLLATAAVITGVVWLVAAYLTHAMTPTSTIEVPLLGEVPTPAALIIGGLFSAFLLSRLLLAHAARLGRRWATRLSGGIGAEIEAAVTATTLAPIRDWDAARRALWVVAREDPIGAVRSVPVSVSMPGPMPGPGESPDG